MKDTYSCEGQQSLMSVFPDEMRVKPPVGSWVYFVTGVCVRKVKVIKDEFYISHDENGHGIGRSYALCEERNGDTYYVTNWFFAKEEAIAAVKSFYNGEVKVFE